MRNASCPICQEATETVLRLRFGKKMQLPTDIELRHCGRDNFAFVAGGRQSDYDDYYASVANDSYHREVSGGAARSPIAERQSHQLASALGDFFTAPRNVLDFGCGEASLLIELAMNFPKSRFSGFEPGPAAQTAASKARTFRLDHVSVTGMEESRKGAPYDLVIASHVIEHVLDFDLLQLLNGFTQAGGLLYVEVPNSLRYEAHERLEFLYYFDRLHVNHFSPQSLARLMSGYGFGYLKHFEYIFPYRDGGEYPALGMLFRKCGDAADVGSPSLADAMNRYIAHEREKAGAIAASLEPFEGVLIWGAGDNFYRSIENGGPLSKLRNMVLLDRRPHEVTIRNRKYQTIDPETGIRNHPWPVVATVSEGRKEIGGRVTAIDPGKRIFFV